MKRFQTRIVVGLCIAAIILLLFIIKTISFPESPEVRGAIVGALFATLTPILINYFKDEVGSARGLKAIYSELVEVDRIANDKKGILRKGIQALVNGRGFLPLVSVNSPKLAFSLYGREVYPLLSFEKRSELHTIYERMRILDEQMNILEDSYRVELKESDTPQVPRIVSGRTVREIYKSRLIQLIESVEQTQKLIIDFLYGDGKDFTHNIINSSE